MNNLHNFTRGAALNAGTIAHYLRPMDQGLLQQRAPSVFAVEPHHSRSERYTYIPTAQIVAAMLREGFQVVSATQSRCRSLDKREHTKHMLKFMRIQCLDGSTPLVGDSLPQVCLVNSHDGSSAYQLYAGLFRFVCSNGLMVCDSTFDKITVRHQGNIIDNVIEGTFKVIDEAAGAAQRVDSWRGLTLDHAEQEIFATAALQLRYEQPEITAENAETVKAPPIRAEQLLRARRGEDEGRDLWATFNRVQENVIKGGLFYRGQAQPGRRAARMHTREVKGIDQSNTLNRALWTLAEGMKRLKSGEALAA